MEHTRHKQHQDQQSHQSHYVHLGLMAGLSFLAMYLLMYSMVDRLSSVYMNVNQVYMAALMTAPMVVIELIVMRMMYRDARLNRLIIGAAVILGTGAFVLIRQQAAVGDAQFLRSMIPHHSGAILMCQQASITDSEIRELCKGIIASQTQEIDLMIRLLARE
jgi:cation transport ATPase